MSAPTPSNRRVVRATADRIPPSRYRGPILKVCDQHGVSVPNHVSGKEMKLLAGDLHHPELWRTEFDSSFLERSLQRIDRGQLKVEGILRSWHHEYRIPPNVCLELGL